MDATIEVNIMYIEKEIKKAITFYILRICNIRTYALIAYPIIIAAIVLSLIFDGYAILAAVFFLCGIILYYIYYQRPIDGYIKFYSKKTGGLYCFNEDAVSFVGKETKGECAWTAFKKAYETPSAFLLIDANEFVHVFSKSSFSEDIMIEQLHDLIAAKKPDFKAYS